VRHLVAAGGLAIAACTCLLLFSGAASAKQAAGDTITVVVLGNGKTMLWTVHGSPFNDVYFNGGSNSRITSVFDTSDPTAKCTLTPTNNGGGCSFSNTATSATFRTIWNGPLPTMGSGFVGFADTSTQPFTSLVTIAGSPSIKNPSLHGMTDRMPKLKLTVQDGQNEPPITSVFVHAPTGLSFRPTKLKFHDFACKRRSPMELGCTATTPITTANLTVGPPVLVESKTLQGKVRKHKVKKLHFTVSIGDQQGLENTLLSFALRPLP
jgi:hypothetical protein